MICTCDSDMFPPHEVRFASQTAYSSHLCPLGATAEAGCWKPVRKSRRMRLYRQAGWTCAHATRPPKLATELLTEGVSTPRPPAFTRSGARLLGSGLGSSGMCKYGQTAAHQ